MSDRHQAIDAGLRPVAPASILAETLASLVRRGREGGRLDPEFLEALEQAARFASGLEPYIAACTTPESAELSQLVAETQREDWAERFTAQETAIPLEREMLSGHVEGQFLKMLVRAMRAERILEVGCFTGYSALAMAEALPADGTLVACELDPFAARFAERAVARSPHGRKIRIVVGDAAETIGHLRDAGETFDLIFIDADKGNYETYFRLALEGSLLAPNGLIAIDNTLMQGQPYLPGESTPNGRAIAAFNRIVCEDPRVEQVLLPLRDGLTLVRRA